MQRIKGVTLSIYDEYYGTLLRQYQDPEGWAVTDAGLNEDEDGYYFGVQARGVGGERQITLVLTRGALQGMLDAVIERFDVPLEDFQVGTYGDDTAFEVNPFVNVFNTANTCCSDGCSCQQSG